MVLWNQQTPTSRLVAEDLFSTPHARPAELTRKACGGAHADA